MAQWYVVRSESEQGPFTGQQLKQLATTGQLQPDDPVRRDDMQTTRPAREIKGLFAPASEPQPTPSHGTSGPPIPPPSAQPRPVLKLTAFGCLGLFLLLMVCTGVIGLFAKRGAQKDVAQGQTGKPEDQGRGSGSESPAQALTADFYPFKTGTRQRTTHVVYVKDTGQIQCQKIYTHEQNGTIRVETTNKFALQFRPRATQNLPSDPPARILHRLKDGFVEIGKEQEITNELVWTPIIKIGAKVGDGWERAGLPGGSTDVFKLTKLEVAKYEFRGAVPSGEVLCAFIERRTTIPNVNEGEFVEEIQLGYGIGPLKRKTWRLKGGGREEQWSEFAH